MLRHFFSWNWRHFVLKFEALYVSASILIGQFVLIFKISLFWEFQGKESEKTEYIMYRVYKRILLV